MSASNLHFLDMVQLTTTTLANASSDEEEKLVKLVHDSLHLSRETQADALLNSVESKREKLKSPLPDVATTATKPPQGPMHWSIYQQEPIPDHIIEAKKRLGQIKQPHMAPNESNAPVKSVKPSTPTQPTAAKRAEDMKHWSQIDNPATPDYIKQIRKRLGDDRYRRAESVKSSSSNGIRESPVPPKPDTAPQPDMVNPDLINLFVID